MARSGVCALPWLLGAVLCGFTLLLTPAPAAGCSYGQVLLEASYPSRDDVDVPTNAVLFVYGSFTQDLLLQRASGEIVPIDVQPAEPSGLDLRPRRELDPLQRYQLRLASPPPDYNDVILEFTTAAGPAAVPEALSAPALDLTVLSYGFGSCGIQNGLCLETSSAPGTTIEVRIGKEVLPDGAGAPYPRYRLYGGEVREGDCVEARARDVRGGAARRLPRSAALTSSGSS